MIHALFKPNSHFKGFIYQIQGNIDTFISIEAGSIYQDKIVHSPRNAFNFSHEGDAAATSYSEKWISFSLLNESFFYVTHYELQQRTDSTMHFMENWTFEALDDRNAWIELDSRHQDPTFTNQGDMKIFPCQRKGIFQQFRIHELEQEILTLKRIDIYGIYCNTKEICLQYINSKNNKSLLLFSKTPFFSIFFFFNH